MIPEFSIIVPIYNAEKTIQRCLKSIQQQTENSFEVLLIDDGSTDRSSAICKQTVLQDKRFVLQSQKNAGPSKARNIGLDFAKGRNIVFIDSDDFVEPCFLKCIKSVFDQEMVEAVFIGYSLISVNGTKKQECIPVISKQGYYETLVELSEQGMYGYTWIKAFKREAIGGFRFKESLHLFEDEIFTCEVLKQCQSVGIVSLPIYNYVVDNEQALTSRTYQDYCEKQDLAFLEWEKLLSNYPKREEAFIRRAEAALSACKYYGFERDVEVRSFFESLASTVFISKCQGDDSFLCALREKNIMKLEKMRRRYRLKIAVAQMIGR